MNHHYAFLFDQSNFVTSQIFVLFRSIDNRNQLEVESNIDISQISKTTSKGEMISIGSNIRTFERNTQQHAHEK